MTSNIRNVFAGSIVVILLLAMHFAAPSPSGLWLRTFYESLHVPVFGIIAICVFLMTPLHCGSGKRLIAVTGAVIGLSVLSELAQIPTSRDASLEDLVADWLGAAGFVALAIAFSRGHAGAKVRTRYLIFLGAVFITWPLIPLAKVSVAYVERVQMLPALVRFDSAFAGTFFHLQNARLTKQRNDLLGSMSAEILLQDGPWPGIVFHDIWPDWEPYVALVIEIENPESDDLSVNIRVDDREHQHGEQRFGDRFNRKVYLAPGMQTIRITVTDIRRAPDRRQMNMAEIVGLVIFATRQESGRRFVLHEIRLE